MSDYYCCRSTLHMRPMLFFVLSVVPALIVVDAYPCIMSRNKNFLNASFINDPLLPRQGKLIERMLLLLNRN